MTTRNKILKELKNVPVEKLEDVYAVVHSLSNGNKADKAKQIIAFAGCFNDMEQGDYDDFVAATKRTRSSLFERDIDI